MSNINIKSDIGGSNNNVIIRIPSKNEYVNILQNSDLNGNIDIASSKSNVWNFNYSGSAFDYSMLQDNSEYSFTIPSKFSNGSSAAVPSYHTMDKSNKGVLFYGSNNSGYTVPCFRPMFEFNQE